MAIIPGVTVDYMLSPRIITIPVAGEPVDVSIEDLQDTLQDIEDDPDAGILFPRLRDCVGGQSLGGGRTVGFTLELQNAQLLFEGQTGALQDGVATSDDQMGLILTDANATFISKGVTKGCLVTNWTSRGAAAVMEVISETQLRHVMLTGGSRSTWLTSDEYRVSKIVLCSVSGGNLIAVDGGGQEIVPIQPSPNVFARIESATSAALVGMEEVAGDVAAAVLDESLQGHEVPGSVAAKLRIIQALAAKSAAD